MKKIRFLRNKIKAFYYFHFKRSHLVPPTRNGAGRSDASLVEAQHTLRSTDFSTIFLFFFEYRVGKYFIKKGFWTYFRLLMIRRDKILYFNYSRIRRNVEGQSDIVGCFENPIGSGRAVSTWIYIKWWFYRI
jgi:hypothetical protein